MLVEVEVNASSGCTSFETIRKNMLRKFSSPEEFPLGVSGLPQCSIVESPTLIENANRYKSYSDILYPSGDRCVNEDQNVAPNRTEKFSFYREKDHLLLDAKLDETLYEILLKNKNNLNASISEESNCSSELSFDICDNFSNSPMNCLTKLAKSPEVSMCEEKTCNVESNVPNKGNVETKSSDIFELSRSPLKCAEIPNKVPLADLVARCDSEMFAVSSTVSPQNRLTLDIEASGTQSSVETSLGTIKTRSTVASKPSSMETETYPSQMDNLSTKTIDSLDLTSEKLDAGENELVTDNMQLGHVIESALEALDKSLDQDDDANPTMTTSDSESDDTYCSELSPQLKQFMSTDKKARIKSKLNQRKSTAKPAGNGKSTNQRSQKCRMSLRRNKSNCSKESSQNDSPDVISSSLRRSARIHRKDGSTTLGFNFNVLSLNSPKKILPAKNDSSELENRLDGDDSKAKRNIGKNVQTTVITRASHTKSTSKEKDFPETKTQSRGYSLRPRKSIIAPAKLNV